MAKKLKGFAFTRAPRRHVYPWDEWLDGSPWELSTKDFSGCKVASFRAQATQAAAQRQLKLRTQLVSDTTIVIQAYKGNGYRGE